MQGRVGLGTGRIPLVRGGFVRMPRGGGQGGGMVTKPPRRVDSSSTDGSLPSAGLFWFIGGLRGLPVCILNVQVFEQRVLRGHTIGARIVAIHL